MKEHMQALQQLYAPLPTDSFAVRKAKAEMAAVLAGGGEFEVDGKIYRCQSKDAAMHNLGLNRRWNTMPQAQDRTL